MAGLLTGLAGILVAVAIPFAPVIGESTVVQWPQAGQPPRPTTAFFVPYRPAELHAVVPCHALRAAQAEPARTTVLATTGPDDATGLVIEAAAGRLRLILDGQIVPMTTPGTGCELRIDADSAGTTVSMDGMPMVGPADAQVPEVWTFDTDLDAADAAGMSVTAHTPYWFAGSPTGWKYGLLVTQAGLVVAALVLLGSRGRQPRRQATSTSGPGTSTPWPGISTPRPGIAKPRRGRLLRCGTDVGVLAVLACWAVIGPLTDDDGFATMIARNAGQAGDIGNYYRWFNASEAPFTLSQQLVRVFTEVGLAPLWLRVPSVLAGALTWLTLHRWVLPLVFGRARWGALPGPVAAVCFLVWWLPYGLGTRPEPFVAAGVTVVLALVLTATSQQAWPIRRPMSALGLAVLVAAATVTVAPSGVLVAAPILLCAPGIRRLLRQESNRAVLASKVALLGGVAGVALTIVFADQSWHGLLVATDIHRQIGPDQPWFAEHERYLALLGEDSWGSAGKRLPVLLTLALIPTVIALSARHGRVLLSTPGQGVLLGAAPVGLLLLVSTPSKWSHHFGSLAGLGAGFLVAAIALGLAAARQRSTDRVPADGVTVVIGLGGAVLVAIAAGLSFAGPNTWWAYSDLGMPWRDSPVRPLHHPLLWLALLGAVAMSAAWFRWRHGGDRSARAAPAGPGLPAAGPGLLAALAATTMVALLLGSFLAAPLRRGEGYSPAAQNLADLRGSLNADGTGCGIEEHVQLLPDVPGGALLPAEGVDELDGFVADGGYPAWMDRPGSDVRFLWGSDTDDDTDGDTDGDTAGDTDDDSDGIAGGESGDETGAATGGTLNTGSLHSAWFALPALAANQEPAVSVAGRLDAGNTVTLEFGRSTAGGTVDPLGRRLLHDPEPTELVYTLDQQQRREQHRDRIPRSWRTRTVPTDEVPEGADRVRVVAVDGSLGAAAWIAVTGPRLVEVVKLTDFLVAQTPVLVDWPIAFVLPCRRDVPVVAGGLAEAPAAIVAVPVLPDSLQQRWTNGAARLSYLRDLAGSFAGVTRVGRPRVIDSRLVGDEGWDWGRVQVIDYGMARDAYDTRTVHRRLPGWAGDQGYRFPTTSTESAH